MMLIPCPWCGPRPETEFTYGEDAMPARPASPDTVSRREWTDYLYFRENPRGLHTELWFHGAGCHHWFIAERDTVTHEIATTYAPGSQSEAAE